MRTLLLISGLYLLASCQTDEDGADAYGNFEVDETVISAQAAGELLQFDLEEGAQIETGAHIGLIDTTTLHNQRMEVIANREAVLIQKTSVAAELKVLEIEQANLQREIDRVEKLVAADAATTKQLDDLQGNLSVLQTKQKALNSQFKVIDAQVAAVNSKLALIEDKFDKSTIINPVAGTVLTKLAQPHEMVGVGKPLYKLADLNKIYLKAYISEPQLSLIQLDQQVTVLIDKGEGEESFQGKISWIASEAEFTPKIIQTKQERVNLVFAIKIRVDNSLGMLKIGMPGEVYF